MSGLTSTPFRVGKKAVYLPSFTLTLLRQTKLPPTFASFLVPLNMNKLDMRDYLYHVYNIRTISIRSFIKQAAVVGSKANAVRPTDKRWFRPRASKKMTVEMEQPFVWPDEPADYEAWSNDVYHKAQKDNEAFQEARGRLADAYVDVENRKSMREQAKALLEGKTKWRPMGDQAGSDAGADARL